MRQIILDTETTGLSPQQGHRVIEIGCVEMINRRMTGNNFQVYLQPDRKVDPGAMAVHGITDAFLKGKPRFKDIADKFKNFIKGAELIIHNAPFDVGFLEYEFALLKDDDWTNLDEQCVIIDTLILARKKHPGQRNNLDALCKRYNVEFGHREKHGALLDAEILAHVYLNMTGGQTTLSLEESVNQVQESSPVNLSHPLANYVIEASPQEQELHKAFLQKVKSEETMLWEFKT